MTTIAALAGLLIASLGVAAVALAFGSVGTGQVAMGRITAFEVRGGRGMERMAVVQVDGRVAQVRTPRDLDCQVGSEIALERLRSWQGPKYAVALRPDPCRRTAN